MINFHVLTLFPDMVLNGLNTSIIGRAVENNIIKIGATDIRDFSTNKHLTVPGWSCSRSLSIRHMSMYARICREASGFST